MFRRPTVVYVGPYTVKKGAGERGRLEGWGQVTQTFQATLKSTGCILGAVEGHGRLGESFSSGS